jgi:hypothetical protein
MEFSSGAEARPRRLKVATAACQAASLTATYLLFHYNLLLHVYIAILSHSLRCNIHSYHKLFHLREIQELFHVEHFPRAPDRRILGCQLGHSLWGAVFPLFHFPVLSLAKLPWRTVPESDGCDYPLSPACYVATVFNCHGNSPSAEPLDPKGNSPLPQSFHNHASCLALRNHHVPRPDGEFHSFSSENCRRAKLPLVPRLSGVLIC